MADIIEFADEMGIAPGIVVGQLQYRGAIPWKSSLNKLKIPFEWNAGSQGRTST